MQSTPTKAGREPENTVKNHLINSRDAAVIENSSRNLSRPQDLGILCYVGISFGPVFTASIGGTRREFMLVGDVVNTAGASPVLLTETGGLAWYVCY